MTMKTKATLWVEAEVWRTFRGECIKRGEKASVVAEALFQEQLKKWGVKLRKKKD